jgi:hypothetical protein
VHWFPTNAQPEKRANRAAANEISKRTHVAANSSLAMKDYVSLDQEESDNFPSQERANLEQA